MKIYVVAFGEYSDYAIAGIFSSKEKAIEFVKAKEVIANGEFKHWKNEGLWCHSSMDIEEWDLDTVAPNYREWWTSNEPSSYSNARFRKTDDGEYLDGKGQNNEHR